MLIDEEEEGMVHDKADLRGQRHEAHLGQRGSLGSLLIDCDGSLVLQLHTEIRVNVCDRCYSSKGPLLQSGLTQLMTTLSDVIPEKSPLPWNMSERPISLRF